MEKKQKTREKGAVYKYKDDTAYLSLITNALYPRRLANIA